MTLLTFFLLAAAQNPEALLPDVERQNACAVCHAAVISERNASEDAHDDLACNDCHPDKGFNPHLPAQGEAEDGVTGATLTLRTCAECHAEEDAAWRSSIHGPDGSAHDAARHPLCVDCHGSAHAFTEESQSKLAMAERCMACHTFATQTSMPTSPHVADTYRDTAHGKMLRLGNTTSAGCADCHTGHAVYALEDERASVHPKNRAATCGACHEGATDEFARVISHVPHHLNVDLWGAITAIGFSVLTLGVIALLFIHALLDFLRTAISSLRRREAHATSPSGAVAADQQVARFDTHMRWQHLGLLISFTLLAVTGWPLKSAAVGPSPAFVAAFGGQPVFAVIHRLAGVLLIAVSIYHLGYLLVRLRRGTLTLEMMPRWRDVRELGVNLAYFVGLRKERPKFGRWAYHEKFDYWAVFWGMVMMGGSGVILWWPGLAARFLPAKLIDLAFIIHSDEALLALLAIFMWHFYNVHLRPTVFPMSWVWLTGKISAEALYLEHRAEYERLYGTEPPRPSAPSTWHSHPLWSYIAVAVVLVGGVAVAAANLSTLRHEIWARMAGEPAPAVAAVVAADVKTPGFDVFTTCFKCHNKNWVDRKASGFTHQQHFDDESVKRDCATCHRARWHQTLETATSGCLECHEASEIGLPAEGKP